MFVRLTGKRGRSVYIDPDKVLFIREVSRENNTKVHLDDGTYIKVEGEVSYIHNLLT
jgi:hypothetical protein